MACVAKICEENEHVLSNACVPCDSGITNLAGDDASGADTSCDLPPEWTYTKSGFPQWEWQGCPAGQLGGNCEGDASSTTHAEAVTYCQELTWGGYDDWELPNINQLRSLLTGCPQNEYQNTECPITHQCSYSTNVANTCGAELCLGCDGWSGPRSDGCYLPADLPGRCSYYWSSSLESATYAYGVHFYNGIVGNNYLDLTYNKVRCVRSQL